MILRSIQSYYGVTLGDGEKATVVRGLWIRNCGFSALGVVALGLQVSHTQFAQAVAYIHNQQYTWRVHPGLRKKDKRAVLHLHIVFSLRCFI